MVKAKFDLQAHLNVLDSILAGREYMAGNTYTIADVNYIPTINMFFICQDQDLIDERPNLKRWWENVSCREASKTALQRLNGAWERVLGETRALASNYAVPGLVPDFTSIDAEALAITGYEHWPEMPVDIWQAGDFHIGQAGGLVKDGM